MKMLTIPKLSKTQKAHFREHMGRGMKGACWCWEGHRKTDGYGTLGLNGTEFLAHRVAWTIAHGSIPQGKQVLHKCDNPSCCNPSHLFVGNQKQNMADAARKNRMSKGSANGQSKLLDWQVRAIRKIRKRYKIPYKRLGENYGISGGHAWAICERLAWRHIT